MKYFGSWHTSIVVISIAFLAAYLLPTFGSSEEVSLILTVTGFLFGVFAAFTLADRHGRYTDLKRAFATESGTLTYIHQLAGLVSRPLQKVYEEAIDNYLMSIFDHKFYDYPLTSDEFYRLFEPLKKKLKANSKTAEEGIDGIVDSLGKLEDLRKEIMIYLGDKMARMEWLTLAILDAIVVFSLFYSKTPTIASMFSVAMLSAASVIILIFMKVMDSLVWKFEIWSVEPYQRVFERIGKLRYYPDVSLMSGGLWKLPKDKDYRLASYEMKYYPKIMKKVRVVRAKKKSKA